MQPNYLHYCTIEPGTRWELFRPLLCERLVMLCYVMLCADPGAARAREVLHDGLWRRRSELGPTHRVHTPHSHA